MESLFEVCIENTSEKLGRKLQAEEIQFLQWVYERYEQEQRALRSSK